MLKRLEKALPDSCLNRSNDDEPVFVLRSKDKAAPATIRAWCDKRVSLGLNKEDDRQITEARECADEMAKYRHKTFPARETI